MSTSPEMDGLSARQVAFGSPAGFLAFGFGAGLAPFAPGTFGTLAALAFLPLFAGLPATGQIVWVALGLLAGIPICARAGKALGVHDHGGIVWDEMAAFWLCLLWIPLQWPWLLAAFVLFRLFDILKPWPIGWADSRVGGGLGVMLDDVLAAGWTILCLRVALWYFPPGA